MLIVIDINIVLIAIILLPDVNMRDTHEYRVKATDITFRIFLPS